MLKKIVSLITGTPTTPSLTVPKDRPKKQLTRRQLLQFESKIGSQLFGEVPAGHRREFFCFDNTTWIWYEEWKDATTGKLQSSTTRYEIQPKGVMKVQEGARYSYIEGEELKNFDAATKLYFDRVVREVYGYDPATGKPLYALS